MINAITFLLLDETLLLKYVERLQKNADNMQRLENIADNMKRLANNAEYAEIGKQLMTVRNDWQKILTLYID